MTETTNIPLEYRFLATEEAAQILGLAPQTLRIKVGKPDGPKVTRIGRSVRYKYSDLLEWVNQQHAEAQALADERAATVEKAISAA